MRRNVRRMVDPRGIFEFFENHTGLAVTIVVLNLVIILISYISEAKSNKETENKSENEQTE